ncbi:hypothetical protein ARMSODRAFT_675013 [Armillaria solidipes]|uniref:Uncharacterized protein n=1 Tax=Armillaria solidipes TaxID=1076256 RepID=A0A2H3B548_9AGAR|nr:hypothetical protein ARMSODRAFT_675013 [Armillaria solidipes]
MPILGSKIFTRPAPFLPSFYHHHDHERCLTTVSMYSLSLLIFPSIRRFPRVLQPSKFCMGCRPHGKTLGGGMTRR